MRDRAGTNSHFDRLRLADRAAAYLFLHDLFRLPGREQWEWLSDRNTRRVWETFFGGLGLPGPEASGFPDDPADYETEYLSAFEVGAPHPPVPLIESHYNRREPVPRILHENVLFYRTFGLEMKAETTETSDHLRLQLEFVAHLYRMEERASASSGEAVKTVSIRRARRDFVERHLLGWLPSAREAAGEHDHAWVPVFLEGALRITELTGQEKVDSA